ncbi:MAG TPA: SRPBCC domain-containing protein [Acidimicrobiales bacterium]|nr:SRPBCC domain-containing protein [Acidimicrobiales bacterium]
MPVDQPLGEFADRHTLVWERRYPHPIEVVFEAVSTGEHLDAWMLPESRVERFEGGACAFGWGSPADDPAATRGTVTVFEPPTTVQYTFDGASAHKGDASFMRFDLSSEGDSTRLVFTLHFLPAPDEAPMDYPGGDLPAPGTAWRPGFCAGYHEFLDDLTAFLAGTLDAAAKMDELMSGAHDNAALIDAYRAQIAARCPSG